jgi:cytochrome c553
MLGAATICAEDAALAYGRHLAGECTACHRPAAGAGAIPAIAGRPAAELLALLSDYRDGRKTNPVMVSVAKSLDDRQMKALAAYFASLPKSASTAAPPR